MRIAALPLLMLLAAAALPAEEAAPSAASPWIPRRAQPGARPRPAPASAPASAAEGDLFLPSESVSSAPRFPEERIKQNAVYPRAALRARLDGIVILEILVDSDGIIRGTRVLEETPPSRGFGAAASRAFDGIRALSPALLNGIPTASRYRYTLRFVCP